MFWRRAVFLLLLGLSATAAGAKNEWVRDERELVPEYGYCQDYIQWMDADLLGRHFAQIVHESSAEHYTDLGAPELTPKLLSYLMGSSRIHYRTLSESTLDVWVQEQANNSIDPPAIFRKSPSFAQLERPGSHEGDLESSRDPYCPFSLEESK